MKDTLTPIIFLTVRNTIQETIESLKAGANDYITKPFSFDELLDRTEITIERKITFYINQVNRITNLVNHLLHLIRFENHKLAVKIEKFKLQQNVVDKINRFALKIKNKNISIKKDVEDDFYEESDLYLLLLF